MSRAVRLPFAGDFAVSAMLVVYGGVYGGFRELMRKGVWASMKFDPGQMEGIGPRREGNVNGETMDDWLKVGYEHKYRRVNEEDCKGKPGHDLSVTSHHMQVCR